MIEKEERVWIGIDPGKKGGVGVIDESRTVLDLFRMPDTCQGIDAALRHIAAAWPGAVVVLELAQAMPKQGVVSMFEYGRGFGQIEGAIAANGLACHLVRPAVWKKIILSGEADKRDKGVSIRVCERVFPAASLVPAGCRKPHDGMAEALLLAEYGRRLNL